MPDNAALDADAFPELALALPLVKWLCHDLATPIASVMTASELLSDTPDPEINDLIASGARRLAWRLRLVRMALAGGGVAVGGAALERLVRDGLDSTPVNWQVKATEIDAQRAAVLACSAMLIADLHRTKRITISDDNVMLDGPAALPDTVVASLAGAPARDNRSAVATLLRSTARRAGIVITPIPEGIAWS